MKRFLALIILSITSFAARAQNTIGIPAIVNYPKDVYNAGSQNWGIAQDKNGIIYFANNQGLLSFDGRFWRKYPLPNKTIARSIAIDEDNRIYIGGQSEFGYFYPSKNGELTYVSLMPLLQEKAKDFTDVWNICIWQDRVFFRAYRKIFEYDRKKITVDDGIQWSFMGTSANSLLAFEYNKGLVAYANGNWAPAAKAGTLPEDINIKSILAVGKDSTLMASLTQGLFLLCHDTITKFTTGDVESIKGLNLYGLAMLAPDRIALITNLSGCIIMNKTGQIVQRITKKEGIQNNNVLSMMLDKDRNLWLGLDHGIDLVMYNNAIKNIFPEQEDKNAGYVSIIHDNQLYLGLASGAYTVPLHNDEDLSYTKGSFQRVQGSKGQVWNFSEVNGKLLMGHNGGAYIIEDNKAIPLDTRTGFWNFQAFSRTEPSPLMLAGTYNGINFYNYKSGVFSNPRLQARFESARFVVQHSNAIWIAHPFKGLYKVRLNASNEPEVEFYNDKRNILSSNHNKIFQVAGRMVLTTDKGIFEFDDAQDDFVRSAYFEKLLGRPVSYLKEDRYGNVWFCRDKKVGVIDKTSGKPRIVLIPELNNRIQADGFENINVIDSNNVLVAAEKGFFHLNYSQYKRNRYQLNVFIRNVRSISQTDSLIFGGYSRPGDAPVLSFAFNSLHFESASTLFGQEHTIEYSYFLEGFDKSWSEWSKKTEKDYTNLPPGNYTFKVRCRNNFDNESAVDAFSFSVLPPWYRTWWAYTLYALLFAVAMYLFYKRQHARHLRQQQVKLQEQQRKYDEEQKRLQMQHQLALSESDKQIAQLRSEKLQAEVEHKNTELASSAMNLVQKLEIFSKIREDLVHFKDTAQVEKGTKEFQKIIKLIDAQL
ncbi:MAG TPA: triple tyrosine motif-containing protein, partial [Chitinophagaceae bacterium]|nr:triple tyrosine motif-containing protein [Chitinophagaceae bacterium]